MGVFLAMLLVLFLWDYTRTTVISFIVWIGMAFLVLAGVVGTFLFGMIIFHSLYGM